MEAAKLARKFLPEVVDEFPVARVQSYCGHLRTRQIPERRNRASPFDYISAEGHRPVQAAQQRGHRRVQPAVPRAGSVRIRFSDRSSSHPLV